MPHTTLTFLPKQLFKFFAIPLAFLSAAPTFASGVPEGWESYFAKSDVQVQSVSQDEAGEIKGALGPAAVLIIPMLTGAAIGSGSYLAGSNNPSIEGVMISGSLGAVAGAAALLPPVPAAIVGGAAGIGAAKITNIIDSRPTGPYGSFPPSIGSAANCTPWTCSWKNGEPVPFGTPGATEW